ncbi:MAG: hypothetical protein QXD59_02155 [Candidatus Caldarchaeum sp.]
MVETTPCCVGVCCRTEFVADGGRATFVFTLNPVEATVPAGERELRFEARIGNRSCVLPPADTHPDRSETRSLLLSRVAPPQPRLEITAPGRETTLYIQHEADGFPTRPLLQNVMARITGVRPDPTATATFRWKVRVQYQTRTRTSRQTEVFWEREAQGGTLPSDILLSCGTIVGETAGNGEQISCVAGGNLLFEVRATVNGQELMTSKEGPRILSGNNPSKGTVQALIDSLTHGDTEEAIWLKRIACQESRQRQFYETTVTPSPSTYRYPGEPVWNTIGDGGVGMMQITETNRLPRPSPAEIWDWRANVEEGVRVFDLDKKPLAAAYPRQVQSASAFDMMVQMLNRWRSSRGMPQLSRVIVPDYSQSPFRVYRVRELNGQRVERDMLVEDTIRGFNGYPPGGQFNLPWHEFWLYILEGILQVENEYPDPSDPSKRIGYAIWARVPPGSRPDVGDPNYVEHVRAVNPACP